MRRTLAPLQTNENQVSVLSFHYCGLLERLLLSRFFELRTSSIQIFPHRNNPDKFYLSNYSSNIFFPLPPTVFFLFDKASIVRFKRGIHLTSHLMGLLTSTVVIEAYLNSSVAE